MWTSKVGSFQEIQATIFCFDLKLKNRRISRRCQPRICIQGQRLDFDYLPFLVQKSLPDPNPILWFFVKLIAGFNSKSAVPGIHVYGCANGSELAW
jgi:hypothetical protein